MSTNNKRWIIEGGNSTDGQVGFVLRGVRAATAEEALGIVQQTYALPEEVQEDYEDGTPAHGRPASQRAEVQRTHLSVYFNAEALTLANVSEDDEEAGR